MSVRFMYMMFWFEEQDTVINFAVKLKLCVLYVCIICCMF